MDRPLDSRIKNKRTLVRAFAGIGIAAFVIASLLAGPGLLRKSISRSWLRSAHVESGRVEATLSASGVVLPEFEQVLAAPISSRILKILRVPGEILDSGDAILTLDKGATLLELESVENDLLLAYTKKDALRLELDQRANDLQSSLQSKRLQLDFLSVQAEQENQLFDIGGTPKDELLRARLEVDMAVVDVQKLEKDLGYSKRSTDIRLRELDANIAILNKKKQEIQRRLALADCRVNRRVALTWVAEDVGASVARGDVIAKVADLGSFKVKASMADINARSLGNAMPVHVKSGDTLLQGRVSSILPTVEQGVVSFMVALDDNSPEMLRSNMRVDVIVVTETRHDILRLRRGPFASAGGQQELFVIRGDIAEKRKVRLGISGFEYVEILDGLQPGEEVIISDMQDYLTQSEINIQ